MKHKSTIICKDKKILSKPKRVICKGSSETTMTNCKNNTLKSPLMCVNKNRSESEGFKILIAKKKRNSKTPKLKLRT